LVKNAVVVVDYGVGNLLSVKRGLEFVGANPIISGDPQIILSASHIVFPGVGAFNNAMTKLNDLGLVEILKEAVHKGIPLMGICLGMQLLFDESEEFTHTEGLALISGKVASIKEKGSKNIYPKVPHIGWAKLNQANAIDWKKTVLKNTDIGSEMYFVHSFAAQPADQRDCVATCEFGEKSLVAVVEKNNIIGCQFHPEKSGKLGLKILEDFCAL